MRVESGLCSEHFDSFACLEASRCHTWSDMVRVTVVMAIV